MTKIDAVLRGGAPGYGRLWDTIGPCDAFLESILRALRVRAMRTVHGRIVLDRVERIPLRAFDASHRAIASQHRREGFATADRVPADAAERPGFVPETFSLSA